MDIKEKKKIEIFCCYAREDQKLLLEFRKQLKPLEWKGLIDVWSDIDIKGGTEWEKEIEKHLNSAQIILLFVSPDFMASNYCYSNEMRRALERHESGEAHVIPIILRPVGWEITPLGRLQALPTNATPITSGKWHSEDEALYNVTEGIRETVEVYLAEEEQRHKAQEAEFVRLTREERVYKIEEQHSPPLSQTVPPALPPYAATPPQDPVSDSAGTSPLTAVPPRSIAGFAPLPTIGQLNHRRLLLVVVAIVLILILLGGGSIGVYRLITGNWLTDSPMSSKTRFPVSTTATAQPTTTTNAQSTITATAQVTATTTAQVTPPLQAKWHARNSGTLQDLVKVARSGSRFVAVGRNGTILTSSDGITWATQNSGTMRHLYGVAWLDSYFVAVGEAGTILTSPDGITWTSQNSGASQDLNGIAWSGSQFVVVGKGGTILTSPDKITWTTQNAGFSQDLFGIARSNSQFVAVGWPNTILTSPDGSIWTLHDAGPAQNYWGVTWFGSQFVVVGRDGKILTSPDGIAWTTQNSGTSRDLLGVSGSGTQFVAVGDLGTILTSPNGITWTAQNSGTTQNIWGVSGSGTQFVAVGLAGTILTSS